MLAPACAGIFPVSNTFNIQNRVSDFNFDPDDPWIFIFNFNTQNNLFNSCQSSFKPNDSSINNSYNL